MKTAVFCFAMLVLVGVGCHGFSLRQLVFGTCVEECSVTLNTCAAGYVCRSNGCGHTCQRVSAIEDTKCQPVLCDLYCPDGFATNEHGCPICNCNNLGLTTA